MLIRKKCWCFLAFPDSTFIRQYLEVDYPKLIRLYGDLWRRLEGISTEMRNAQSDLQSALDEKFESEDEADDKTDGNHDFE